MEPVAKAERYVVGVDVVDDDDNDDDPHEDNSCDQINNPPCPNYRVRLAINHRASLGFSLCNVGGRREVTRNTAQCKHTICSLQNQFGFRSGWGCWFWYKLSCRSQAVMLIAVPLFVRTISLLSTELQKIYI